MEIPADAIIRDENGVLYTYEQNGVLAPLGQESDLQGDSSAVIEGSAINEEVIGVNDDGLNNDNELVSEVQKQEDSLAVDGEEGNGQEVLVFDEELGEYQRYVYVTQDEDGAVSEVANDSNLLLQQHQQQDQVFLNSVEEGQQLALGSVEASSDDVVAGNSSSRKRKLSSQNKTNSKSVIINQEGISNLQPGTLIQCNKCWETFLATEFQTHYTEVHGGDLASSSTTPPPASTASSSAGSGLSVSGPNDYKACTLCDFPCQNKKGYVEHFKSAHAGVKLACPKCPQTYHSPELLNAHYKHFHENIELQPIKPKRAHVMSRCELCDDIVEDIAVHLVTVHEADWNGQNLVIENHRLAADTPEVEDSGSVPKAQVYKRINLGSIGGSSRKNTNLHCEVCSKDYPTQRDFTNHKRRKDFCKPPFTPSPPVSVTKPTRRVGILRRGVN